MAIEKKITPTMTLAHLYEAQKQYFDAFTLYNILYKNNPNDEVLEKLKAVEKKIFSDLSLEYNKVINQIFSEEDKEKFRLLPDMNFQNFKEAMEKDNFEPVVFQTEEFEEPNEEEMELEIMEEDYFMPKPKSESVADMMLNDILVLPSTKTDSDLTEPSIEPETDFTPPKKRRASLRPNHHTASSFDDDDELSSLTISEFSKFIIKKIKKDKKISDLTFKEIKEIKNILQNML